MQTVTPLRPKPNDAAEKLALVQAKLAEKPDGVVEAVAREVGVSTQIVLEALPADTRIKIGSEHFETVWKELAGWGEVLFIVNTVDIVLECKGSLPVGSFASGYYNIHGDSPIGGHIRASNCQAIYLVDRMFHGRRSCSVQFFNGHGEAMFKVFVMRDKDRSLIAEQLSLFEDMKNNWASTAASG